MNIDSVSTLNLARKWRSRQFHEIVGQELSIRLIKNSLYTNLIFPVYLFAGTRGCGKTSTARLFAAALNCENLNKFISDTNFLLPCLECFSCKAMQKLNHPDFIEVDAASNNGVDNIRQIIESSSFVPTLGRKKIYLIDEAHMLSKAAFNALLKILEEPPDTVVFMLATTDSHKIIDTVRSRCFQLFFNPIDNKLLVNHLSAICELENIVYEIEALDIIVQQAKGSARDALNIIERIRLSCNDLTKDSTIKVIGYVDRQILLQLLESVLVGDIINILKIINQNLIDKSNLFLIYSKWIEFINESILLKYGQQVSIHKELLSSDLINNCSVDKLVKILDISCSYEFSLTKTAHQFIAIELLFIKLAQLFVGSIEDRVETKQTEKMTPSQTSRSLTTRDEMVSVKQENNKISSDTNLNAKQVEKTESNSVIDIRWQGFLKNIETLNDPLVISIFKQGIITNIDEIKSEISILFSEKLLFFKDWVDNTKVLWQPLLDESFFKKINLNIAFTTLNKNSTENIVNNNLSQSKRLQETNIQIKSEDNNYAKVDRFDSNTKKQQNSLNIEDKEKWKKANMLLKIFPGKITDSNN